MLIHYWISWTELCMYRWISHDNMSSHILNDHELKGHCQTVADNAQNTEASFPFDSICVKGPQEKNLQSMTIMPAIS